MINPDFLMTYAKSLGLYYLYDVNGDGIVNTKDINQLKLAQTATDYHLDGWNINNKLMGG